MTSELPPSKELADQKLYLQLLGFLQAKYVQRADSRQREMGLQYMEAETHDLARTIVDFLSGTTHEPPAGCAECSNVAPIAKLTVRDGLAVRAGLYAPGLPDGDHDVYPSASSQPPSADAEDAAKWRALRNCARITAMGSAGCHHGGDSFKGPTAHLTLNFWTHNAREHETYHREWLDVFVEKAVAAQTKFASPE